MFARRHRPDDTAVAAPGDGPLVQLRNVHKTYDVATAPVRALRGVDLQLDAGEFVAIAGTSGSGKSTLLSIVAGLETPDDGRAVVAGLDLMTASTAERAALRRHHVAIVFQFFRLLEQMTAHQNVAFAALVSGAKARVANDRATDLLDELGLLNRARDLPMTMSGGERQRLAIARALAAEPSILLADEPTGSLDSAGASEIVELLARLNDEGQTILLVTHDAGVAASAHRVVTLRDGTVAEPVDDARDSAAP